MLLVILLKAEERINEIEHRSGRNTHNDTWKEKLMKCRVKKVKIIWVIKRF